MVILITIILFIVGFKTIFFGSPGERKRLDKFYKDQEDKIP